MSGCNDTISDLDESSSTSQTRRGITTDGALVASVKDRFQQPRDRWIVGGVKVGWESLSLEGFVGGRLAELCRVTVGSVKNTVDITTHDRAGMAGHVAIPACPETGGLRKISSPFCPEHADAEAEYENS